MRVKKPKSTTVEIAIESRPGPLLSGTRRGVVRIELRRLYADRALRLDLTLRETQRLMDALRLTSDELIDGPGGHQVEVRFWTPGQSLEDVDTGRFSDMREVDHAVAAQRGYGRFTQAIVAKAKVDRAQDRRGGGAGAGQGAEGGGDAGERRAGRAHAGRMRRGGTAVTGK